jgi:hypothetical protein
MVSVRPRPAKGATAARRPRRGRAPTRVCHDASVRRLGAVAAVAVLLVAGACGGSDRHAASSTSTSVPLPAASGVWRGGTSGPDGQDCLGALRRAGSATLAATSFTVAQDAWREQPASSTVSGGGAAVITYSAPDRFHVRPSSPTRAGQGPLEQIFVGPHAWQGSTRSGWVAYTTHAPTDPIRWLRVPGDATRARWSGGWCTFVADVEEGTVTGQVGLDPSGHLARLQMTLTTGSDTIAMGYRVSRLGSSPPVVAPT